MITNFLFVCYMIFMSCSLPVSIGLQTAYKSHKLAWADSVIYVATRQMHLVCIEEQCMPVDQSYGAGTSFVIDKVDGKSILMTAAHLCYPYNAGQQSPLSELGILETRFDLSIVLGESLLIVQEILVLDVENDICVFSVPVDIGREMPISRKDPRYGDNVWTIGAPAGYFPESAKPITRGTFSGEAERRMENGSLNPFFNFTMPAVGGMSGSPIINEHGEVVGIVSAVNSDWHLISFSPTLDQIKDSIDLAMEKLNSDVPENED